MSRDYGGLVGGSLLVMVGAGFALYAIGHYELGSLRQAGPGMFPAILGILLALLGIALAVPSLRRPGEMPAIDLRAPFFILASVVAFGLVMGAFGLVPAIVAAVAVSSFAEPNVRPMAVTGLCVGLSVTGWLIFSVGLGLPVAMFRWPF